jgi:hypothetical protein
MLFMEPAPRCLYAQRLPNNGERSSVPSPERRREKLGRDRVIRMAISRHLSILETVSRRAAPVSRKQH